MRKGSIWLLRHGETTGGTGFRGSTDDPLSEAGWTAMHEAVASLTDVTRVVTSPLMRCRAFSEMFAASRQVSLFVDARIRELHFGAWEGRSAEQILRDDPVTLEAFWRDPYSATAPDGEPFSCFEKRIESCRDELMADPQGNILLVTHAGPIRLLNLRRDNLPLSSLLAISVPHATLHRLA
jgi:alpha-ribazole phosphatase